MGVIDYEDPNPIGWPTRAYWQALADSGVHPDDVWDLIWGPDVTFSQEVASGSPMAPDDLTGSLPAEPWGRRTRPWREALKAAYREIGEYPEDDEYKIEAERFRTGPWNETEQRHEREPTLSLNYPSETDAEFIDYLEDVTEYGLEPLDDEYDIFTEEIKTVAGLTRGEAETVRWVASGNTVSGVDYLARMGEALGKSSNAAELAWRRARVKIGESWAEEPEKRPKPGKGHHQIEGAGVSALTVDGPRKEWNFG